MSPFHTRGPETRRPRLMEGLELREAWPRPPSRRKVREPQASFWVPSPSVLAALRSVTLDTKEAVFPWPCPLRPQGRGHQLPRVAPGTLKAILVSPFSLPNHLWGGVQARMGPGDRRPGIWPPSPHHAGFFPVSIRLWNLITMCLQLFLLRRVPCV